MRVTANQQVPGGRSVEAVVRVQCRVGEPLAVGKYISLASRSAAYKPLLT
jgi:hypothetical protein